MANLQCTTGEKTYMCHLSPSQAAIGAARAPDAAALAVAFARRHGDGAGGSGVRFDASATVTSF